MEAQPAGLADQGCEALEGRAVLAGEAHLTRGVDRLGVDVANGFGDVIARIASLTSDERDSIEADIQAGLRDLSLTTLTLDAANGVASEMGQYSLNIQIEGSESKPDSGKYVVVWKRQPGGVG